MARLSASTLDQLPESTAQPGYDRQQAVFGTDLPADKAFANAVEAAFNLLRDRPVGASVAAFGAQDFVAEA